MALSGKDWVNHYHTSARLDDLAEPFRTSARRFVAALQAAGASVIIADTLRPPERAYLMHFAFKVAHGLDPAAVPAMAGVAIEWLHPDAHGKPDPAASQTAAQEMVEGFGIQYEPSLTSRHTEGHAIDMNITWQNNLTIRTGNGVPTVIASLPRTGAGNADLHRIGASYGVLKLATDPPHWSLDGH
jgi:hypothetical protein